MSYLILGGTGTVGSEVVRALQEKGADLRVVTRSPEKLDDGVEAVEADMIDHTIVRPSNFHQNDHWFREAIVDHGVYPQPLGPVGVSAEETAKAWV